ncbi:DUF6287 domain-containing protein [Liquorilactobacillus mali]|uniref:DUF6287 domain-containing protein n=1 Tax=Liquorilactobacillus mali TaxID=1618 RepID=UPI00295591CD|nr:DUF6287 domain-containing protein [Liquorilactobacillus mali]MDV7757854.1 hypothetical protein [Liquorilactobacillus mali]
MSSTQCWKVIFKYQKSNKKVTIITMLVVVAMGLSACNGSQAKQNDNIQSKVTSISNKSKSSDKKISESNSEQSSATTADSQASQAAKSEQMNLSQIQLGNYESLLGNWKEVAISVNRQDGTGSHWEASNGDTLSVTKDKILNGSLSLQKSNLNDGNNDNAVVFSEENGYLAADLENENVAINYAIYFYPKGVVMTNWGNDLPVAIDNSKNRIVIWTSNNSYTEVFQGETN